MRAKTKTFKQFSAEAPTEYDFSSTQFNLPGDLATRILEWGDLHVPDSSLYTDPDDPSFGREDQPHITVLYGIHSGDPKPLEKLLYGEKSFEIVLGKMSLFTTNDKFDVLKINVEAPALHKLHSVLTNSVKTTETYPKYIPHVTIVYAKKGKVNEFVGDATFEGESFVVRELSFSSKNGKKTLIRIGDK